MLLLPTRSTLFPYTTLFRSGPDPDQAGEFEAVPLSSEGKPSGKLDEARRTFGGRDLKRSTSEKCYVWQLGGTIENRVIPDIEEICRKLEILVFADTEVLANRDIPVLLKRTTEGVSAQVAETGFSIGTNHRSGAKSCRIKIVVDSIVDVPVGLRRGDRETWIQRIRAGVRAA